MVSGNGTGQFVDVDHGLAVPVLPQPEVRDARLRVPAWLDRPVATFGVGFESVAAVQPNRHARFHRVPDRGLVLQRGREPADDHTVPAGESDHSAKVTLRIEVRD